MWIQAGLQCFKFSLAESRFQLRFFQCEPDRLLLSLMQLNEAANYVSRVDSSPVKDHLETHLAQETRPPIEEQIEWLSERKMHYCI